MPKRPGSGNPPETTQNNASIELVQVCTGTYNDPEQQSVNVSVVDYLYVFNALPSMDSNIGHCLVAELLEH